MSKQRPSGRLERRAEREAKNPAANTPRARRQRAKPQTRKVDVGPSFLPPFMRNLSATSIGIAAIALFTIVALGYVVTQTGQSASDPGWVKAQEDADPNLPGKFYAVHPGPDGVAGTADDREHFRSGSLDVPICTDAQIAAKQVSKPLCYTSNPPTSGPHADQPMPFKVLDNPAPKENLIHNMEHGGVVIWYNTTDQSVIDKLKGLANDQIDRRRLVVLTAYSGMEANTIAVTSWTRLDKFTVSEFTAKRIEDFINEHHKRFNPEGF